MSQATRCVPAFTGVTGLCISPSPLRCASSAFVPRYLPCLPASWREARLLQHTKRSRGGQTRQSPHALSESSTEQPGDFPGLDPELRFEEELKALEPTTLRWCEIPFESLEEELSAIDEYAREEELEENNSWARFLRGAAYEHWGRASLASVQYDLVRYSKGLRLIPDLWMRKAYNCFKLGDVAVADRLHDIASLIQAEAIGNQMHFSFWFENEFKDFKPRHNGPPFAVQSAICKYSCEKFADARVSLCAVLVPGLGNHEDLEHAALWLLATSARINSTIAVDVTGLPRRDVDVAKKYLLGETQQVSEMLAPLAALYLDGTPASVKETEDIVKSGGEHGVTRAFYMALFYDSLTRNAGERDRWLDVLASMVPPKITHDTVDFLYWAGRNRITVPPGSASELPALEVPL
jgi:hypothetical protein